MLGLHHLEAEEHPAVTVLRGLVPILLRRQGAAEIGVLLLALLTGLLLTVLSRLLLAILTRLLLAVLTGLLLPVLTGLVTVLP